MGLRKLGRIVGISCLLGLSLLVVQSTPAAACSCAAASTDRYLEQAAAAFLGDVIAERIADPESVIQGEARLGSPEMIYTLDVQTVYKGAVPKRVEVSSPLHGASCGAELRINHRYVVFARPGTSPPLQTGLCDGTYEPDGVNTQPLAGGRPVADVDYHDEEHHHGPADPEVAWHGAPQDEELPQPGVGPTAFAGLMLVSAAIAGALLALAGRT